MFNMGCFSSRQQNIFQVKIIHKDGKYYSGKLEITPECLILYSKHRNRISWPLDSLRRFGFGDDIFSFEAGRRCPTGEGVFSFWCLNSEELKTVFRESIKVCGNTITETTHGTLTTSELSSGGSRKSPSLLISPPQLPSPHFFYTATSQADEFDEKFSPLATTMADIRFDSINMDSEKYLNMKATANGKSKNKVSSPGIEYTPVYVPLKEITPVEENVHINKEVSYGEIDFTRTEALRIAMNDRRARNSLVENETVE